MRVFPSLILKFAHKHPIVFTTPTDVQTHFTVIILLEAYDVYFNNSCHNMLPL